MKIIDAYVHCGLSKYKPIQDLERSMKLVGVEKAVIVQHLGEYDNTYIQNIICDNPKKFAGVLLVDYTKKETQEDLHYWTFTGKFRGVRLILRSLERGKSIWQEAYKLGLNIVVGDPEDMASRLDLLFDFLEDSPKATIVLYHMGEPRFNNDSGLTKYKSVFKLRQYPNVYFQISGMHLFCDYPYEILWPFMSLALESFGPERVLWGGNYPLSGDEKGYLREIELIRDGVLPIPPDNLHQVVYHTAMKLWFS